MKLQNDLGEIRISSEVFTAVTGSAAVLAAMNIADQYFREQDAAENLRRQIKDNLEEVNQLKMELSEAKREIFKLQNRK